MTSRVGTGESRDSGNALKRAQDSSVSLDFEGLCMSNEATVSLCLRELTLERREREIDGVEVESKKVLPSPCTLIIKVGHWYLPYSGPLITHRTRIISGPYIPNGGKI